MKNRTTLVIAALVSACSAGTMEGSDAGNTADVAPIADTGAQVDAARPTDGGSGVDAPAPDTGPRPDGGTGAIRTVFLVLMENHNWSDIQGSASAPYLNSLLSMGAHAEQYFNPPGIHPSEPNYLWLEAGSNFGILNDLNPSTNHQSTTDHLVTQLETAGVTWRSYQEGISGTTCPLTAVGHYAPKHNPMVFFDDVTNTNSTTSARCIAHVRPYTELATDLSAGTVAQYNFITPDLCHDMHNTCQPLNNSVAQGDTWLAGTVPRILRSAAYRRNGAIIITWDEGEGGDGPIGMIVLSPLARGHGFASYVRYTHSSTLRTLEEIFGVRPFLGDSARSNDLGALFKRKL